MGLKSYLTIGLVIILLTVLRVEVKAQGIGAEVGANFSNVNGRLNGANVSTGFKTGVRAGIIKDEYINDRLSLQYGLFYSGRGAQIAYRSSHVRDSIAFSRALDGAIRLDYIEIPIYLQYQLLEKNDNRLFIGAGPYIAFAIGGLLAYDVETVQGNQTSNASVLFPASIGSDPELHDFEGIDYGLNFNTAYELRKGFYFRLNGAYGLNNIIPEGDADNTLHNWGLSLTAGYMLR